MAVAMLVAAPAWAASDDVTLDRLTTDDGAKFELVAGGTAERSAGRSMVVFGFAFRPAGDAQGGSLYIPMRAADQRRRLSAMSQPIDCTSVLAVVGTVISRARTVEAVTTDGRVIKLPVRRAPASWHYRGRVFGALLDSVDDIRVIRARDARRRVVDSRRLPRQRGDCFAVSG